MESNKRAGIILMMLVVSAVVIFHAERNFLVNEVRGSSLSQYKLVDDIDKVYLLVDDFEGLSTDTLGKAGFFNFGNAHISIDHTMTDNSPIAARSVVMVQWQGQESYGGWGKGVGANIDIDPMTDYISFRIQVPASSGNEVSLKVILEEDDNENGKLDKDQDDAFFARVNIPAKDGWQMISIPLKEFQDENEGGDHTFNVTRKGGLHNVIFAFEKPEQYTDQSKWYFDFICFSKGKLSHDDTKLN